MLDVIKILREIHQQDVTIPAAMEPVIPAQLIAQAIHSEMDALSRKGRAVVVDQRPRQHRHESLVAYATLHHALLKVHGFDVPRFTSLVKIELDEALTHILAVFQARP